MLLNTPHLTLSVDQLAMHAQSTQEWVHRLKLPHQVFMIIKITCGHHIQCGEKREEGKGHLCAPVIQG